MKRKLLLSISFTILLSPFITQASSVTQAQAVEQENQMYLSCKQAALSHKDQTMLPALKEYVAYTEAVVAQEKNDQARVQWFSNSSYQNEINNIEYKKSQTMIPINQKIAQIRNEAKERWRAEDALCDYFHNKAISANSPKGKKLAKK